MARLALLVVSVVAKGAVALSPACCHHQCPEDVPKSGDECTISLGYDDPPDTCEYNEHCQTCDGGKICVNTTFATCTNKGGGFQGKWRIAVMSIAPCKPCEKKRFPACPLIYRPVCGSNGKTYPNECMAKADCQFEFTEGTCCPKEAPKSGSPCALSSAIETCEYDEYCQTCDGEKVCANTTFATCTNKGGGLGGKWAIAMAGIAPCPPCEKGSGEPELCTLECNNPVCGSNGRTYCNECLARADCQFDWTKGPCSSSCEKGSGEPELCTGEYDPVCGKNGKTYSNACEAEADCQKWTKGKCECKKGRPKPCPKIYRPVCASNGETYGNACLAEADCEFDFTEGECCKDTGPKCKKLKNCKKRNSCQATCAERCLKDNKFAKKKCPKDKKKKCPPKGKLLDCTNKKTKKSCPVSCPACVLPPRPPPFNCYTKEVWSEEKVKWCCDNMQLGCPRPPPFNCYTKERWSEEKVKWCCDNMQLGCPRPPPFNCYTKEVWSEEKVEWCCDNMQLGCPAPPAPPP